MRRTSWIFIPSLTLALVVGGTEASEWSVDCTGAGTHRSLGAALADAADGDTLRVRACPEGAYPETVRIVARSGLTIRAEPLALDAVVLPMRPAVELDGSGRSGPCLTIESSHSIRLLGLGWTGCAAEGLRVVDSHDVLVARGRIDRAAADGVLVHASRAVRLIDNVVVDNGGAGIVLSEGHGHQVVGNALGRNDGGGIRLLGGADHVIASNGGQSPDIRQGEGPRVEGFRATDDETDFVVTGSVALQGPVGVGTTDPDRDLDVTGPAAEVQIDSVGGGDGPELVLTNSAPSGVPGSWAIKYRNADGRFSIYRDQDPLQEAVSVFPGGLVGVGTKTPDRLLDLTGPSATLQIDSNGGDDGPELVLTNSDAGSGTVGSWSLKRRNSDGRFSLVRDQQLAQETVSISPTGDVGLGTTEPTARLDVVGSARLTDGVRFYGCGQYVAVTSCPAGDVDGPSCDAVPAGAACEGDGECGTSSVLDNCGSFDWYVKTSE